jgi:hypothetical protein
MTSEPRLARLARRLVSQRRALCALPQRTTDNGRSAASLGLVTIFYVTSSVRKQVVVLTLQLTLLIFLQNSSQKVDKRKSSRYIERQ